jgi:hypothetical protein
MGAGVNRRLQPYQLLDLAVVVLGMGFLALAIPKWTAEGAPLGLGLIAVPLVCLVSLYPLVLLRTGGDVEIGFDAAVLVGLGLLVPHPRALVIWTMAGIISQGLSKKRLWARVFNVGLVTLVGSAALATMSAVGGTGRTGGRELLAVFAGATV